MGNGAQTRAAIRTVGKTIETGPGEGQLGRMAGMLDPEGLDRADAPPPTGADDPGKEYQQKYAVAVECSSEAEQETVYEKLNGEGYACRLLTV